MEQRRDTELMNRLLGAIAGTSRSEVHGALEYGLRSIKRQYEERWPRITSPQAKRRKMLLQKMRKNTAERRKLRRQLGTEGAREMEWMVMESAILLRRVERRGDPPVPSGIQWPVRVDNGKDVLLRFDGVINQAGRELMESIEEFEDQIIRSLIGELSLGYRKTPLRKLVIEPFLLLLAVGEVWETAEPRTRVMAALFDWLGVEPKYRPTNAGMRTIVRAFGARPPPVRRS